MVISSDKERIGVQTGLSETEKWARIEHAVFQWNIPLIYVYVRIFDCKCKYVNI